MPKSVDPVDAHVGGRVRNRRKFLGLSQTALAEAIGLTFQQVQKYEKGNNRISASKLYDVAKTLRVPVAYFFDGYAGDAADMDAGADASEQSASVFLSTSEGIELASTFPRIVGGKTRRRLLDLVRALADD
ncbi:helix-turn-helix transcriptional regulator [Asticcacaulis sp. 201]|uniref:helix-turn-helix domain-containing protein n=1 Tax=Asticcacaulis sp. 201 TaxID=3028787 RepID=UPI002916E6D0|nr:helix-turn-helix transcriptional regulator [Asticcacaulis sp. 201]MDV6329872.1 helix-turn-helix transcriptional regulator [Asticcacaulis sp. 201]